MGTISNNATTASSQQPEIREQALIGNYQQSSSIHVVDSTQAFEQTLNNQELLDDETDSSAIIQGTNNHSQRLQNVS